MSTFLVLLTSALGLMALGVFFVAFGRLLRYDPYSGDYDLFEISFTIFSSLFLATLYFVPLIRLLGWLP